MLKKRSHDDCVNKDGHQAMSVINGRVILLTTFLLAQGCGSTPKSGTDLDKLRTLEHQTKGGFTVTGLRHIALRDAALSLGARGGLAWRAKQVNHRVKKFETKLDRVFNFRALVLDDNVLPPVLIEGRKALEQADPNSLRVADRHYYIQAQAKFVTMPPTWRDYLHLQYSTPEMPDRSLLPRNDAEKEVWDRYVQQGWQAGIAQADTIFLENLGRLRRDYTGMIRYHSLLAQGVVSKPFVAKLNMGITGGGDQLAVNDQLLKITALPSLRANGYDWKPEVVPE